MRSSHDFGNRFCWISSHGIYQWWTSISMDYHLIVTKPQPKPAEARFIPSIAQFIHAFMHHKALMISCSAIGNAMHIGSSHHIYSYTGAHICTYDEDKLHCRHKCTATHGYLRTSFHTMVIYLPLHLGNIHREIVSLYSIAATELHWL